ncbi:MAG: 1-(5-phosphoribosyl)-5-amino-4-imidazole-carboxylate carboxylase [Deltaproteobacteria bacterium SG8_13]|nr:MAG: 1-(5-phosphoribosyl)-5-amino-4-imidazole-carboxylate carboxylase [Deltaproteobacteria bacterium SG8_13]
MNTARLQKILASVAGGQTSVQEALAELKHLSVEDIEYAHIDHHRSLRKGFPEVIYGEGKSTQQIAGIMEKIIRQENVVMVTRVDSIKAKALCEQFPEAEYHDDARMIIVQKGERPLQGKGIIAVISAGTSDIPVAREAYLTASVMGNRVESLFDVGVAGIHRLFQHQDLIQSASVLIVAAGMEGALPAVVAGVVDKPVIAVPTSVGYGVSFGGLTALFAMLNSCSSNVAVVNIDNGFGAGYLASIINRL